VSKPKTAFHKNSQKSSGLRTDCRDCRNTYRREYRKQHREKFLAYENSDESKQRTFVQKLKREYGITLDIYNEMVKSQNNLCKICEKPENHKNKIRLSVDHCHKTGKVRSLLCHKCNIVLGLINEDEFILGKIQNYLKEN
jgi:hypothetical protein